MCFSFSCKKVDVTVFEFAKADETGFLASSNTTMTCLLTLMGDLIC